MKLPFYGQPAMGAGTDTHIITIGPVGHVMPAFLAPGGMIRRLVGRQTRRSADVLRHIIHVSRNLFRRQDKFSPAIFVVKGCALLHGQLIQRQMIGRQIEGFPKLFFPVGTDLSHAGIDQIKAVTAEIFLRQGNGVFRFLHTMFPAKRLQVILPERLYTEGHPVDPGRRKIPELFSLHTGRVGFQSDFRAVRQGPVAPDAVQQAGDSPCRHQ